jgi:tetratricopeptide (TPR) repeat protein
MDEVGQVRSLLMQRKYREAAAMLDDLLPSDSGRDDLWYLRGITFLKARNYDGALECFERALIVDRKSAYSQIKGMAHFELLEIEKALEAFSEALALEQNNATTHFFLALCYLFLDDPRADAHMKKALGIDAKKTKQLLLNFYTLFIKDEPKVNGAVKRKIEERMKALK